MPSVASFLGRWSPALANKGFSEALRAYQSGKYDTALADLLPLAKNGHAESQMLLAHMYRNGEGATVSFEEAAHWTRLAAEQGDAEAQFNLGVIYDDGIGVSEDIGEALCWYRRAAQFGFPNAQINLASCFHNGRGVDPDESLAAWWIRLAAEQGDTGAQLNLGNRYLSGIGVSRNLVEAFFWFDLALKAGNSDAVSYRANAIQLLSPDQISDAQTLCQNSTWQPQSGADSAMEIFKSAARYNVEAIQQALGEEQFDRLKITQRTIPDVGRLILEETHGIRPVAIATNIREKLTELEGEIDLRLNTINGADRGGIFPNLQPNQAMAFIRRLDNVADVGTLLGDAASKLTHNVLEFHLSLIGALEEKIDEASLTILLKRFSLRDALRASGLVSFSGLQLTLLPLPPW
ncbi:MAG TPA: tetratricopeptide repeat protein [Terracidiphilus sp.]|nr:tetratricopeptide repeat protein [Terracidiphilus sp.]